MVLGLAAVGCGASKSSTGSASQAELTLQREQLVAVVKGLQAVAPSVSNEVAAAKAAWPKLAPGLPRVPTASLETLVGRVAKVAAALPEPGFMVNASRLTGPAAGLAGLYETFARLSERGWKLTEGSIATTLSGPPSVARFAKANSTLYVHSIYDGHYDLSLIGKSLAKGYERLGGAAAFRGKLSAATVSSLEKRYSIDATRLSPHPKEAG